MQSKNTNVNKSVNKHKIKNRSKFREKRKPPKKILKPNFLINNFIQEQDVVKNQKDIIYLKNRYKDFVAIISIITLVTLSSFTFIITIFASKHSELSTNEIYKLMSGIVILLFKISLFIIFIFHVIQYFKFLYDSQNFLKFIIWNIISVVVFVIIIIYMPIKFWNNFWKLFII